jgi:hypothetical protein
MHSFIAVMHIYDGKQNEAYVAYKCFQLDNSLLRAKMQLVYAKRQNRTMKL